MYGSNLEQPVDFIRIFHYVDKHQELSPEVQKDQNTQRSP
jgi:hypothetical protein